MASVVLPSTHNSPPEPTLLTAAADIQQLAAEGYFQAIAYWLNQYLVPQNIYAQVLEDDIPGRLKILIEFERPPRAERLVRFVCDRLYKLNSEVIQGVLLVARSLGSAKTNWQKAVRIPTASQRQSKKPKRAPAPKVATHHPPQKRQSPVSLLRESPPTQAARSIVRSQFKFFRAALVTGTAAIALAFGGLTELVVAGKLIPAATQAPEPVAAPPWYADEHANPPADFPTAPIQPTATPEDTEATAVSFRPASRFEGRTVEAALETIAVIPHDDVATPTDPTITLMFGGELSLKDFIFEEASSIDQLFSDINLYQQADISMIGLAEPLANASTTLQEDFYRRTRPQAVQALKTGGIDIVGLFSEGTMTYGQHGLDETLRTLDRQGIYRVGAGRNEQEAHRPEILEVKGQRIAYLGYNPDAIKGAKAEKAGVALASSEDREHIIEDIRAIRSQVDWVVVNYRWGEALEESDEIAEPGQPLAEHPETQPTDRPSLIASEPADWQKSLAHEAVDAGADLVVGYHPTQLQGAEIYRDRAIAYSLGDFVFSQSPLEDHDTAALRVSLRNQRMKVEFLPVTIRDAKLQMAVGDRSAAILQAIRNASQNFAQPLNFPAVLKANPNFKLPDSQVAPPRDADYPSAEPDDPADLPAVESPRSEPAPHPAIPHPAIQEPDALFAPEAEEKVEPAPTLLETDEKADELEEIAPPRPDLQPHSEGILIEDSIDDATSRYQETDETIAPFVDPFLDPYYDSSAEEAVDVNVADTDLTVIDEMDSAADSYLETPSEATRPPASEGIQPYAEPLVGPLSVLPVESTPEEVAPPNPIEEDNTSEPPRPKVFND